MRFAGTWKQYSKKAIPQATMITFQSASLRNFRWPYQAKVMKMFEIVSSRIVRIPRDLLAPRFGTDLRRKRVHRSCSFVKRLVPDSAQLYFHPLSCFRFLSLLF